MHVTKRGVLARRIQCMAGDGEIDLRQLVADLAAALERGDIDSITATLADDVVVEHPAFGIVVGADANVGILTGLLRAVAPEQHELADVVVDGERAAFRMVIRGTVREARPQLPPSGTDVE